MIRYYLNGIVFDRDLILSIRSMLHGSDLDTDLVMADKRGRGVITDDGGEPLMFPLLLLLS